MRPLKITRTYRTGRYLAEIVKILRSNRVHCTRDMQDRVVYALHNGLFGEFYSVYGCAGFRMRCMSIFILKIMPERMRSVESYLNRANEELEQSSFFIDKATGCVAFRAEYYIPEDGEVLHDKASFSSFCNLPCEVFLKHQKTIKAINGDVGETTGCSR